VKIFISGGCKNGKSTHAQRIAKIQHNQLNKLYYIATMIPKDDEDHARIERHISERKGMGFKTVELPKDIIKLSGICEKNSSILLDSTTALLSNEMFTENKFNPSAHLKIGKELNSVLDIFSDIVIVSDFIYSDSLIYDEWTEAYRKGLAYIDKICAEKCDIVLEAFYGNLIVHKGADEYKKII
jgi:adenosylcobinamide kinase/adenosylcobinamide-phosphate guanylyltransferase